MSDPRADRGAYLDRVAARLGLPDDRARDVLDELEGHLSESIEGFVDQGLTPDQAERQSIARLGDPVALADGLRRAQQTRRRLLAAAGAGVVAAVGSVVWGYLIALAVSIVAGVLSLAIISTTVSWLQLSINGWGQWGDEVSIPFAAFVAGYAGRRLVLTVAWKSARRVDTIRVPIALIGGVLLALLVVFGVRTEANPASFVLLLSMPVGFVVGVLLARDGAAERTRKLPARWLGIAMVVATVIGTVVGFATLRINPPNPFTVENDYSTIGPPATDVLGVGWLDQQSSTGLGDIVGVTISPEPTDLLAGWRDVRLEAWPSTDGRGVLQLLADHPASIAPMVRADDGTYTGELDLGTSKEPRWFATVTTGVAPDGARYVLTGPDGPTASRRWNGTIWEYFTTP
jgi:hypothetical protein